MRTTSSITRRSVLIAGLSLLPAAAAGRRALAVEKPTREGRIPVAGGRRIGFAEYGNPAGPLVLYFHGTPGSRAEVGLVNQEAISAGVRLVAVERPGIGMSDYQSGRRILHWPADVECVAAALGSPNEPFGVVGLSGGAPYALACVQCIPHRLTHVAVVSGHTPLNAPGTRRGNQDNLIEFVDRRPRLANIGFNVAIRQLNRKPQPFLERVSASWSAADRQMVMCNAEYRATVIRTLREATRCGASGVGAEVQLLAGPWGFRLSDLPFVPVSIWHGGCDPIAPVSMGHYFHRQLAGSELIIDPSAGHLTMIKWHAAEILARFSAPVMPALATG
jgi:pimeloyl-ACP methyl ester carboxylesterase